MNQIVQNKIQRYPRETFEDSMQRLETLIRKIDMKTIDREKWGNICGIFMIDNNSYKNHED